MIRASVRFDTRGRAALEREFSRRLEKSALQMTDRAAAKAKGRIRADMAAAGLGRLGFALGSGSDLKKSGQVHRKGNGWSASGWVAVRSRSQRTQGAIESYTEGSTILPRRGRYLWFATDDIKRLARVPLPNSGGNSYGNVRLEPRLWDRTYGRTLGPLFPMKAADGTPLLAIRNATLSLSGKARSARPLTKTGKVPKGQVQQEVIIAFIGIPRTSRKARINVPEIMRKVLSEMAKVDGVRFSVS